MSTSNDKLSKTTKVVKIIEEPVTKTYYMLADKSVEIGKSFTCPHCDEKTNVIKKIYLTIFDVEKGKFNTLILPADRAQWLLTKAYNTLLMRITRAMNVKGFWAKIKAILTKKEITFPNPSNTFWTIKYDKDSDYKNMEVTSEVKE